MKVERKAWLLAYAIVLAMAFPSACADHADSGIKPCPCSNGNVCCESGVCAADATGCGAATSALSAAVEGRWSGFIENLDIRGDTPDTLRIMLDVAPDSTISGQTTFGDGGPPPAPTDPALPWPPNYDILPDPTFMPGISYTARDIKWQSRRLKFSLDLYEAWQPWCALQQPYPVPRGDFMPNGVSAGDEYWANPGMLVDEHPDAAGNCPVYVSDGVSEPINCDKYWISTRMCQCDAGGCHARDELTNALDIAFDGATAKGSINFGVSNYNLRLVRDP